MCIYVKNKVCKSWRSVLDNPYIWRSLCKREQVFRYNIFYVSIKCFDPTSGIYIYFGSIHLIGSTVFSCKLGTINFNSKLYFFNCFRNKNQDIQKLQDNPSTSNKPLPPLCGWRNYFINRMRLKNNFRRGKFTSKLLNPSKVFYFILQ